MKLVHCHVFNELFVVSFFNIYSTPTLHYISLSFKAKHDMATYNSHPMCASYQPTTIILNVI